MIGSCTAGATGENTSSGAAHSAPTVVLAGKIIAEFAASPVSTLRQDLFDDLPEYEKPIETVILPAQDAFINADAFESSGNI